MNVGILDLKTFLILTSLRWKCNQRPYFKSCVTLLWMRGLCIDLYGSRSLTAHSYKGHSWLKNTVSGNPYWRGGLCTVNLIIQSSLDQQLLILKKMNYTFYKTCYLNKEVNRNKLSLQLVFPAPTQQLQCLWNYSGQKIFRVLCITKEKNKQSSKFVQTPKLAGKSWIGSTKILLFYPWKTAKPAPLTINIHKILLVVSIETGLEQVPFVVFVYFFLIWTCQKPANYGPQQH